MCVSMHIHVFDYRVNSWWLPGLVPAVILVRFSGIVSPVVQGNKQTIIRKYKLKGKKATKTITWTGGRGLIEKLENWFFLKKSLKSQIFTRIETFRWLYWKYRMGCFSFPTSNLPTSNNLKGVGKKGNVKENMAPI